ncbi:glycosyltransferase family 4 protein [Cupriavidus basilensis]|uniref:glycosyltransferase family 4 protein n=1 Tax=Cupriavidus basilensis TaxID=68895 RepID=UPI000751A587|nr:glycosyltransferase family 1 protein [Cupriavidus basilensis]
MALPWKAAMRALPPAGLRVAIDARTWSLGAGTGVDTYARMLGDSLARAGVPVEWLTGGTRHAAAAWPREAAIARWCGALRRGPRKASLAPHGSHPVHDGGRLFREAQTYFNLHRRLLRVTSAAPPTVMHWTYPLPLYLEGARNVYTVHDLIPLTHPRLTGIRADRHQRLLDAILSRADHLVTVSDHSRTHIIDMLGCPPGFVTNTSQAVHAPLQRDPRLPAGLRPGGYFICCGMPETRKNLPALVAAHRTAMSQRALVVAGPLAHGVPEMESMLARSPGVIRLPLLPHADLVALIRQARAMLFPSLAEGFGLPVAEAMALGTPVMASTIGALREVGGGGALFVDPHDTPAMARAIRALDSDDALCRRLRAAGFEQVAAFAPRDYADRMVGLYARLAGLAPALPH